MTAKRRKQIERQIIGEIRAHQGYSIFWATENQDRATVLTRMIKRGAVTAEPGQFPWTHAIVNKARTK